MPLLVEKYLASETASDILAKAEDLVDEKLFSLKEFVELLSLDLERAAMLLAPFAAFFGIDLDLDTTNAHFNPREHQQVNVTIEWGECKTPATAPVKSTGDLNTTLGEGHAEAPDGVDEGLFNHYVNLRCSRIEAAISMLEAEEKEEGPSAFITARLDAAKAALEYKRSHGLCEE